MKLKKKVNKDTQSLKKIRDENERKKLIEEQIGGIIAASGPSLKVFVHQKTFNERDIGPRKKKL